MATPTQQKIAEALKQNRTNLRAWAKAHNYKYNTVWNTVMRWAGRDDRTPHGGIARLIMEDLEAYVEAADVKPLVNKTGLSKEEFTNQLEKLIAIHFPVSSPDPFNTTGE